MSVTAITRTDVADRSSLGEMTRSRVPVALLMAGSGLMALGNLLMGLAYLLLHLHSVSTSVALLTAGGWLAVAATVGGLLAVFVVGWRLIVRQDWRSSAEVGAAAVSSMLVVIGFLIAAIALPDDSHAGWIVAAVGLGGWMLLALANAGRRSIHEQQAPVGRQSDLWLAATVGLLALAVATALPSPSEQNKALPIAENVVSVVAWLVLAITIDVARQRRHVRGRGGATLVVGLVVMAAGSVVGAVASGFVYSASATFDHIRIGASLPNFVHALGWAVLAFAAFQRLAELSLGGEARSDAVSQGRSEHGLVAAEPSRSELDHPTPDRPTPERQTAERLAPCEHCGSPLPPEAAFCPGCGRPVEQASS